MELLCGEGSEPDFPEIVYAELFLNDQVDHIKAIKKSVFTFSFMWRPIRIAINNQGRLGLQFLNILGKQKGMLFDDEHSSFKVLLPDIDLDEFTKEKLTKYVIAQ